ncbi:MAG: hypothetical protein DSY42_01115 [Aquifex sp.]|nr:MAG: hypothetical protein DSY42_01115 [Aquifex sp.]
MRKDRIFNKARKGFTLTELVIVLVILGILAAIFIPRVMRGESKALEAGIQKFIVDVTQAFKYIRTAPECGTNVPANANEFRNMVSDSQCRRNTTDNNGFMKLPQRAIDKYNWTWTWNANTQRGTLTIQGVDSVIGQRLANKLENCNYNRGNLVCTIQ